MTPQYDCGICGVSVIVVLVGQYLILSMFRSQNRQAIQTLDDARDAVQTLHVGPTSIITGSVDGYVRTYDLRMGVLRADFIGRELFDLVDISEPPLTVQMHREDPVTAVVPSQDGQTYLATTLDAHVRLMDMSTGKMLNEFTGHANSSYRCRACFGHGEASVVCGDEKGMIWAWDLLDVRYSLFLFCALFCR